MLYNYVCLARVTSLIVHGAMGTHLVPRDIAGLGESRLASDLDIIQIKQHGHKSEFNFKIGLLHIVQQIRSHTLRLKLLRFTRLHRVLNNICAIVIVYTNDVSFHLIFPIFLCVF